MFLCIKCGKAQGSPDWWWNMPGSRGPCEDCGKQADCQDVPAGSLRVEDTKPDEGNQ
jgi:hypothetical protein